MLDAIFSCKSISGRQAKILSKKISQCLSCYNRKEFEYLDKSSDVSRTNNAEVFYNIEIINEAIQRQKWLSFKYMDYDEYGNEKLRYNGYEYICSPCYLINNFGRYYFLAYREKYDSVSSFRLDYMKDIHIIETKHRINPKTLKEFISYSSITDYINDHVYLFGGQVIDVVMSLKGSYVIQYIYDWFGKKAKIYHKDEQIYAEIRCEEMAFYYWAMQYSEHITIKQPQSLIERIVNAADNIKNKYSN